MQLFTVKLVVYYVSILHVPLNCLLIRDEQGIVCLGCLEQLCLDLLAMLVDRGLSWGPDIAF